MGLPEFDSATAVASDQGILKERTAYVQYMFAHVSMLPLSILCQNMNYGRQVNYRNVPKFSDR